MKKKTFFKKFYILLIPFITFASYSSMNVLANHNYSYEEKNTTNNQKTIDDLNNSTVTVSVDNDALNPSVTATLSSDYPSNDLDNVYFELYSYNNSNNEYDVFVDEKALVNGSIRPPSDPIYSATFEGLSLEESYLLKTLYLDNSPPEGPNKIYADNLQIEIGNLNDWVINYQNSLIEILDNSSIDISVDNNETNTSINAKLNSNYPVSDINDVYLELYSYNESSNEYDLIEEQILNNTNSSDPSVAPEYINTFSSLDLNSTYLLKTSYRGSSLSENKYIDKLEVEIGNLNDWIVNILNNSYIQISIDNNASNPSISVDLLSETTLNNLNDVWFELYSYNASTNEYDNLVEETKLTPNGHSYTFSSLNLNDSYLLKTSYRSSSLTQGNIYINNLELEIGKISEFNNQELTVVSNYFDTNKIKVSVEGGSINNTRTFLVLFDDNGNEVERVIVNNDNRNNIEFNNLKSDHSYHFKFFIGNDSYVNTDSLSIFIWELTITTIAITPVYLYFIWLSPLFIIFFLIIGYYINAKYKILKEKQNKSKD